MSNEKQSAVSGEFAVKTFDHNDEFIKSRIYTVRGAQVMLDRDLAALYGVQTRVLNQAVKRNSARFPVNFMFQLTTEETATLMSQIVTSSQSEEDANRSRSQFVILNKGRGSNVKYMPDALPSLPQKWAPKSSPDFSPQSARRQRNAANTAKASRNRGDKKFGII